MDNYSDNGPVLQAENPMDLDADPGLYGQSQDHTDGSVPFDESRFLEELTRKIANVLRLESQVLLNVKLDGDFSRGVPGLNTEKLERLTVLSEELFSDVTLVSKRLHDVASRLKPSFTRLSPFFLNQRARVGEFESFSYTLPLELQVASQMARLQREFLTGTE